VGQRGHEPQLPARRAQAQRNGEPEVVRAGVARLQNVIKFRWELVPKGGDEVVGAGLEVLILGNDGRIRLDYQFIEG
jgi:hypothetical protein